MVHHYIQVKKKKIVTELEPIRTISQKPPWINKIFYSPRFWIFNRPSVAGAVLQIAMSIFDSDSDTDPFPPILVVYLQNFIHPNRKS